MKKRFKFNPNKRDVPGGRTNGQRAEGAESAASSACRARGEHVAADEDAVRDLIADLGHLCDREGLDYEAIINTAMQDWRAER